MIYTLTIYLCLKYFRVGYHWPYWYREGKRLLLMVAVIHVGLVIMVERGKILEVVDEIVRVQLGLVRRLEGEEDEP